MIENIVKPVDAKKALINITLLGPLMAGKSSIANLIVNNVPKSHYLHTENPQLFYYSLQSSSNSGTRHIEIEDTTIDIEYNNFYSIINSKKSLLFKNSIYKPITDKRDYFLVIFDCSDVDSWKNAKSIFLDLRNHNQSLHSRDPFVAIVAHKTDLKYPVGLLNEAQSFASANNVYLFKTSIWDREVVRKMIRQLVSQLDF